MKKNYIILCLIAILFYFNGVAQKSILPSDLIKEFLNLPYLGNKDVILSITIDEDDFYLFTLKHDTNEKNFKLKPLTYPEFKAKLKNELYNVLAETITIGNSSGELMKIGNIVDSNIEPYIKTEFAKVVTYINTEEEELEVATIHLKDNIKVFSSSDEKEYVGDLTNVKAELTFYHGFIEKIQVHGDMILGGKKIDITFNNKYSIGISSTANIKRLSNNILSSDESFSDNIVKYSINAIKKKTEELLADKRDKDKVLKELYDYLDIKEFWNNDESIIKSIKSDLKTHYNIATLDEFKKDINKLYQFSLKQNQYRFNEKNIELSVNVGDVIRYVKKVDVNANDVSPKKQLVLLDDETHTSTKLHKEKSTRLLEAIVYTDFLSLVDEENPNGIVQTEVRKRFNINTFRTDRKWGHYFIPPFFITRAAEGVGFLQFFDAEFKLSKIEKNNKFLLPEVNGSHTQLSLYQHRNYSIGGIFNLVNLENQNAKVNMYLNSGVNFGRSGYKLSDIETAEEKFVNNIEVPIEFQIHLLPEKRLSVMLTDRLSWFENFSNDDDLIIKSRQLDDPETVVDYSRWLNTFNIGVNLDLSSTGRLFLRYKLVHDFDNINNNFSQLQFGYSFFILKNYGGKVSR
ncbi:hypothetical protein [Aquimarina rhabdastrellae]